MSNYSAVASPATLGAVQRDGNRPISDDLFEGLAQLDQRLDDLLTQYGEKLERLFGPRPTDGRCNAAGG